MGVLRRLGKATRASLGDIRRRAVGSDDKQLSELSDAELEEELMRRRRDRARGRSGGGKTSSRKSPQDKQLAQYYANLELRPGATRDDIKRAYRELMRKYHPDKFLDDPDKHRSATELAQSLTEAYRKLNEHLEAK